MDVFDLMATIDLDASKYQQGLDDAESEGKSFGGKLKGALGTAAKVGAATIGAVTTATTVMTGAFVKGVGSVASYGDNIDKMSQKMGMSAQAYQEWDAVMQHSGTSMEAMKASMKTLANAAETGNEAFEQLGITQEEIANMSQEQLFERTISALQNVGDETQRTYLAGKTLGRGATELGALLNTSAEDTQAMRDRVRELGGVMSDDAVKASAKYQDSLQDMKTAFSGIGRSLISEFLPGVTTVIDGLTEIFSGNSDKGIGMVTEGVNNVINGITESAPKIINVMGGIFSAISQAVMDNLPTIIEGGTQIIINLITGMIEHLPDIVSTIGEIAVTIVSTVIKNAPKFLSAGTSLLSNLRSGISGGASQAITAFFNVITRLVSYVMQNAPRFLASGVQLIGRLATGIINGLPSALSAMGSGLGKLITTIAQNLPQFLQKGIELVGKIAAGIIQAIPKILSAIVGGIGQMKNQFTSVDWGSIGINIMSGIANGIRAGLGSVMSALGSMASAAWNHAKSLFKIGSPSKLFRDTIGKMIGAGTALGITDSIPLVESAIGDMEDSIVDGFGGFDSDMGFGDAVVESTIKDTGSDSGTTNNNTWNITIDGAKDPVEWANQMIRELSLITRTA